MVSKSEKDIIQEEFNATDAIAFLVTNSKFPKIEAPKLESVVKDRENYCELFKAIGINHVIKAEDSYEDYEKGLDTLQPLLLKAHDSSHNMKLFIFFVFSSHGVLYGGSPFAKIVFDEEEEAKRYYDAERKITKLAKKYNNLFFLVVFDTCRNTLKQINVQHKGIVEVLSIEETNKRSSKVFIWRTGKNETAPATSELSKFLRENAEM